jgi:glycosyltransferase involved in cell wall biosynthesis
VRASRLPRPLLYEAWLAVRWPRVEAVTGPVDVVHATTILTPPCKAPLVVTIHDLAFRRPDGGATRRGRRVFERALTLAGVHATLVLCSSRATLEDCAAAGIDRARLRHVPLGVDARPVGPDEVRDVRTRYRLPSEFVLFTGTIEPRKNLAGLIRAMRRLPGVPLVVAGPSGWGESLGQVPEWVRLLGFVPEPDKPALLAAASVVAYPSLWEGFGLPVLEAMAQGTPVVTSAGTSTEEVAGGAAVLVDPSDDDSLAEGIRRALADPSPLRAAGLARAAAMSWDRTVEQVVAAYREAAGVAPAGRPGEDRRR